ncbi:MAG: hypothetical protein VB015_02160 [Erysipelotrichaceae bacterium]|nr:hypothetical protein [Erysipelotrichaceae bacterium]
MDIQTVLEIFKWSLVGIFVALILFLIIAMLIGLKRGVFDATFRLLFMVTLVIVSLSTMDLLIDAIGDLPIEWVSKFVIITRTDTNEGIAVATSTVFGTLRDSINATFRLFNVSGSSVELYNLSIAVAKMVIKYALFIVDMILIVTLGNLLCTLLWHIVFKHFIPKAARKIVKIRWLSMLEGGLKYIIVFGMFLVPFSALANTINQSWQKNKPNSNNEILVTIGGFVDTYNQSILAQSLFNWTVAGTDVTFDTSILNTFTSVTIDGVKTSLMDQLSTLTNTGLIVSGAIDEGTELTIDLNYLLSTETLSALFQNLNASGIITYVLPIAASIALNSDILSNYVDTNLIDTSDINWKNEIENLESMSIDIIKSGLVESMFDENGQFNQEFDPQTILDSILSDSSYGYIKSAFEKIDNSKLLSRAVPAAISMLASSNDQVASYLPASWAEMNDIKWGTELGIVYDTLFRLNKVDSEFLTSFLSLGQTDDGTNDGGLTPSLYVDGPKIKKAQGEDGGLTGMEDILKLLSKNSSAIKTILIGEFDRNGDLLNCNEDGITIVNDSFGRRINGRSYSLFDTSLVKYIFPTITNTLVSTLGQSGQSSTLPIDTNALQDAMYDLSTNGPQIKNYKVEFAHIIDTLTLVADSTDALSVLTGDSPNLGNISNDLISQLQSILVSIDGSKILTAVLKPALEGLLTSPEMTQQFASIGLNPTSFNFDCPKLGQELSNLLGSVKAITAIVDDFGSGSDSSSIVNAISKNYENLALLLDTIFDSEIVNPKADFYDDNLDNNYFTLLNYIFGESGSQTMPSAISFKEDLVTLEPQRHGVTHPWSNSRTETGDYYRDRYGNPIFNGENGYIAGVIATLGMTNSEGKSILDVFNDPTFQISEHLSELDEIFNISKIMSAVDKSSIFANTFGDFLNANLTSLGLINIDQGISFNNVDNWAVEGQNFANICKTVGRLGTLDFSNLDFTAITNIGALNQALHALANSSIFIDKTDGSYLFNVYLYDKMQSALTGGTTNMLCDPGTSASPVYSYAMADFEIEQNGSVYRSLTNENTWNSDGWINSYMGLSDAEIASYETSPSFIAGFYKSDEIGKLSYFLKMAQEAKDQVNSGETIPYTSPIDALTSGKVNSEELSNVLLSMNDAKCLRMLVYHSFDSVLSTINLDDGSSGEYNFAVANVEYLIASTTTKEDRDDEINITVDLWSNFEKAGLIGAGSNGLPIDDLTSDPKSSVYLYNSLMDLDQSMIYHRSGPRNIGQRTAFQNALYYYYTSNSIKVIYYNSSSPKDIANASIYSNSAEKANLIIRNYFTYGASTDYSTQEKEISNISEIMAALSGSYRHIDSVLFDNGGTPYYDPSSSYAGNAIVNYGGLKDGTGSSTVDFGTLSIASINSDAVYDVLTNLNISDTLYDCVPNAIEVVLQDVNSTSLFGGASPINFDYADTYYIYTEFTGESNPDYNKRFYREGIVEDATRDDADELRIIADLVDQVNQIDEPDHLGSTGIDNFGRFTDTQIINVSEDIKDTLTSLSHSYILHRANADTLLNDYLADSSSPKLTILEQLVKKLYSDTGLSAYAFNSSHDSPQYINANDKLISNIKAMTAQDLSSSNNTTGFSNTWDDEINAFSKFIVDIKPALSGYDNFYSSFALNMNNPTFSPSYIGTICNDINKMDLVHDALPNFVKSSFQNMGLSSYATYNSNDATNYYLTQQEYNSTGGIDSIIDLLNAFSNKDGSNNHTGYFSLSSSSINDFVSSGRSTGSILKFIYESKLYDNDLQLSDSTQVKLDGYFMYKMIENAGIDEYVLGNNVEAKAHVLDKIIHDTNSFDAFDYSIEGKALDGILANSSSFASGSGFNVTDFSTIVPIKTAIYNSMMSCIGYDDNGTFVNYSRRAYISSEVVAGLLDQIARNEESKIVDIQGVERAIFKVQATGLISMNISANSYGELDRNSYNLLNAKEAKGIYGILSLYRGNQISDYAGFERYNESFDNLGFVNCFEYMEDSATLTNSRGAYILYAAEFRNTFDVLWNTPFVFTPPTVDNPTVHDLYNYDGTNGIGFEALGVAMADSAGL